MMLSRHYRIWSPHNFIWTSCSVTLLCSLCSSHCNFTLPWAGQACDHLRTFEQVVPVYELPLIQHCRLLPFCKSVQMSLFSDESFPKPYLNSSCSPCRHSLFPLPCLYCLIRLESTNHFLNHNIICLLTVLGLLFIVCLLLLACKIQWSLSVIFIDSHLRKN